MIVYFCVVLPETVCSRRKAKTPTKKTGKVKRDWRKTSTLGTPEHKEMKIHSMKQTHVQMMYMMSFNEAGALYQTCLYKSRVKSEPAWQC